MRLTMAVSERKEDEMNQSKLPAAILLALDASPAPIRWNAVQALLEYGGLHGAPQFYDVVWKMYGFKEHETAYVRPVSADDDPEFLTNPPLALTEAGVVYAEEQRQARRQQVADNEAEWDTTYAWLPAEIVGEKYKDDFTRVVLYFHGSHMNNASGSASYAIWERGERLVRLFFAEGRLRDVWGWSHRVDPDVADVLEAAALWGPLGTVMYDRR